MPTYDYRCSECGHEFEEFQKMSAGALRKCPACKRLRLKRLMGTGAGIIFKGSGFYETDYKHKSSGNGRAGMRPSSNGASSTSDNGKAVSGSEKGSETKSDRLPKDKAKKAD